MEQGRLIPGWLSRAIAVLGFATFISFANAPDRSQVTWLKTLSSAGSDFRGNDRDWSHVNDFWTSNVTGLYTMTSSARGWAVAGMTNCLEHFENPCCSHPVKDWPQQSCPLRIYWTNVD